MKFIYILLGTCCLTLYSYSQCPTSSQVNSSNVTISTGSTCELTETVVYQGGASLLTTNILRIEAGAQLTINGNLRVYDRIEIYGTLIVNGDVDNSSLTGSPSLIYVAEGGSFQVNGNYWNGKENILIVPGEPGKTVIDGDMQVSGTYYNNDQGTTIVSDTGTLQTGEFKNNGGTITVPEGDPNACKTGCCGGGCSLLPIKLLTFEVKEDNGDALITWITVQELNNDFFEIQKKEFDDEAFETIARIDGAGNSEQLLHYEYTDLSLHTSSYYRLKQVDYDGTVSMFETRALMVNKAQPQSEILIFPNPSNGNISIRGADFFHLNLYDSSGKLMESQEMVSTEQATDLINEVLKNQTGSFILKIGLENEIVTKRINKY